MARHTRVKTQTPEPAHTAGKPVEIPKHIKELQYVSDETKIALAKLPDFMPAEAPEYAEKLKTLRNTWEYAVLMQWLSFFKGMVKLSSESIDSDVLEEELLGISSPNLLTKIQLGIINSVVVRQKDVSLETFDDRTREVLSGIPGAPQFLGSEEEPVGFAELEIHEKRIEPVGWSDKGGMYFLLDDNRLYFREDSFESYTEYLESQKPAPRPAAKKRKKWMGSGRKKRQRKSVVETEAEPVAATPEQSEKLTREDFVDRVSCHWTCVCVSLADWVAFIRQLRKGRSIPPNHKQLAEFLVADVLPEIEISEVKRRKAAQTREKERIRALTLQPRKRSARIEARQRQRALEEEAERLREEQEERIRTEERRKKYARLRSGRASGVSGSELSELQYEGLLDPREVQRLRREERERNRAAARLAGASGEEISALGSPGNDGNGENGENGENDAVMTEVAEMGGAAGEKTEAGSVAEGAEPMDVDVDVDVKAEGSVDVKAEDSVGVKAEGSVEIPAQTLGNPPETLVDSEKPQAEAEPPAEAPAEAEIKIGDHGGTSGVSGQSGNEETSEVPKNSSDVPPASALPTTVAESKPSEAENP